MNSKKPEWCEKEPFKKTLCWVSDINKKPTEGGIMIIVIDYDETSTFPFRLRRGTGYKYAVPLTNKELLGVILEDQENE